MRLLCLLAGLLPALVAAGTETLTLATYNVENYGPADRRTEAGFRRDYPKPESEKTALRGVIRALGADLLALQEIGSPAALEELRRDLRSEGLDYPQSAYLEAEDRARHLAVLARRPLRAVRGHPVLPFAYLGGGERVKRGLLEVVVGTPAGDLTVYVVHLKSRLTERADDPGAALRRAAEAAAVRACVRMRFPDPASGAFVILGDCNDGEHSAALRRLAFAGTTRVAWRLPLADSRGESWTERYARGDAYAELDQILVSAVVRPWVRAGAARIHDGAGVEAASDHRPVVAVLEFGRPGP
jgi:endonuclease/exonuclease/phosphatase family metal-dependent hydrolase